MKTFASHQKKLLSRPAFLIAGGAVVLLVASAITYVYAFNGNLFGWQSGSSSQKAAKTNIDQTGNAPSVKPTTSDSNAGENTNNSSKNTDQSSSTSTSTSSANTLKVTITVATPTQTRVLIEGIVGSGTCTLVLTRDGSTPITLTADTYDGPSSTTCKGFDYDALTGSGWKSSVSVTVGPKSGLATRAVE